MKQIIVRILILNCIAACSILTGKQAAAQIIPDSNTFVSIGTNNGSNSTIDGGIRIGDNLFYSFREFSVPTAEGIVFNNAPDVKNIISIVTGDNVSRIDGLLSTNKNANLFFLNPAGIVFQSNANLDIGGSFLGSSAKSLIFADGNKFSAANTQNFPFSSASTPISLQFGDSPGDIINRSVNGLQVKSAEAIALVGGDIFFDRGTISVNNGRIELGSVAGDSVVNLSTTEPGLSLNFGEVNDFQDIGFFNSSLVNMGGENGDIEIIGRNIKLQESQITTNGGSTISIDAQQSLSINDGGASISVNVTDIKANPINITSGGTITVDATDSEPTHNSTNNSVSGGNIIISSDGVLVINSSTSIPEPSGNIALFALISLKTVSTILSRGSKEEVRRII